MNKYIAFDIETAKDVPGTDFDWKPHRPLGISCIASLATGDEEPTAWFSRDAADQPAKQMSQADVAAFVKHLFYATQNGFAVLTWNGLSFDFDILAEESGMSMECKQLAREHVDMMFHIVCEKGFPVGLAAAADGLQVPGKLEGVLGIDAPSLWAKGEHDKVLEYVKQDVRMTLAVAEKSAQQKKFQWKTRKGTISQMPLRSGWFTVEKAMQRPLPDTSWMTDPPSRSSFSSWIQE
jgi:hypothetical protein